MKLIVAFLKDLFFAFLLSFLIAIYIKESQKDMITSTQCNIMFVENG